MAKKSKKVRVSQHHRMDGAMRDTRTIATRSVHLLPSIEVQDRRRWHPLGELAKPKKVTGSTALYDRVVSMMKFQDPREVLVCVRRKRRKGVLHALRKTGRVGQRKRRSNWLSKVRCK